MSKGSQQADSSVAQQQGSKLLWFSKFLMIMSLGGEQNVQQDPVLETAGKY